MQKNTKIYIGLALIAIAIVGNKGSSSNSNTGSGSSGGSSGSGSGSNVIIDPNNYNSWQQLGWSKSQQDALHNKLYPAIKTMLDNFLPHWWSAYNWSVFLTAIKSCKTKAEVSFFNDILQYEVGSYVTNLQYYMEFRGAKNYSAGITALSQVNSYINSLPNY